MPRIIPKYSLKSLNVTILSNLVIENNIRIGRDRVIVDLAPTLRALLLDLASCRSECFMYGSDV